MLVLHDNPVSSNAQKARFLLALLDEPYERRTVPFGLERPAWHLEASPFGGIPALVDGAFKLSESQAILRYLARRAGRDDLLGRGLVEEARVDELLDAVSTALRPDTRPIDAAAYGWRKRRGMAAEAPARDPAVLAAAIAGAQGTLTAFAALLGPAPWGCLERLTLGDIAAAPFLHRLSGAGALAGHPRLEAWADAVLALDAWQAVAVDAGV